MHSIPSLLWLPLNWMQRSIYVMLLVGAGGAVSLTLDAWGSDEFSTQSADQLEEYGWQGVAEILDRIVEPSFPDQRFPITDYGAVADQQTDCWKAVKEAIVQCHQEGGGRVIVPPGAYLVCGPIHLLSNVNLHLQSGATLYFSTDPHDYTPLVLVRWEGTLCYNYSPLIYAYRQNNIAVTGQGILDGQTQGTWARWKSGNDGRNQSQEKPRLRQAGNDVTPVHTRVFGNGFLDLDEDRQDDGYGDGKQHYLRPSFFQPFECQAVLVQGVTFRNSPFWNVHPTFCENVVIRDVVIEPGTTNDDGIDPDSCKDVLIENCTIKTHDDAIAIKAGRDQDAWDRAPCTNIIVRECKLNSGVNGVCVGSEMSAGVRNVFVEDCDVDSAKRGITFKSNLDRGGQVERVFIRDIRLKSCEDASIVFRLDYHGYRGNNFPTKFNDFFLRDIQCLESKSTGIRIVGVPGQPINRVYLRNVEVLNSLSAAKIEFVENVVFRDVSVNGKAVTITK